jgi:hypothetical protein
MNERKRINYMIRYPAPRPRARTAKSRALYLYFGLSSVAPLTDV